MTLTVIIIIVTAIVSIMCFGNATLANKLIFNAWSIANRREYWRFFTHALMHGGWGHLIVNMFVLYSFGNIVEVIFASAYGAKGGLYYVLFYVIAAAV